MEPAVRAAAERLLHEAETVAPEYGLEEGNADLLADIKRVARYILERDHAAGTVTMRPWTIAVRDGSAYLEDGAALPAARCRDRATAERIVAALAASTGASDGAGDSPTR